MISNISINVMCSSCNGSYLYSVICNLGVLRTVEAWFLVKSKEEFIERIYQNKRMQEIKREIDSNYPNDNYRIIITGINDQRENRNALEQLLTQKGGL